MKLPNKETYEKFQSIFDMNLAGFKDITIMAVTGKFAFDIFRFDKYCHKYLGYKEEKHGSLNDFITRKHGEEASKLIVSLLDF